MQKTMLKSAFIFLSLFFSLGTPFASAMEQQDLDPETPPRQIRLSAVFASIEKGTPTEEDHDTYLLRLRDLVDAIPAQFQPIVEREFEKHKVYLLGYSYLYERSKDEWVKSDPITNIESYYRHLCVDPAHLGNPEKKKKKKQGVHPEARKTEKLKGVLEAFIGLLAIEEQKIEGPLVRGPAKIEFYANGVPYDVKTTQSKWCRTHLNEGEFDEVTQDAESHVKKLVKSMTTQIKKYQANLETGRAQDVKVLLDVSYLSANRAELLGASLSDQLSDEHPEMSEDAVRTDFIREKIIRIDLSKFLGLQEKLKPLKPRALF